MADVLCDFCLQPWTDARPMVEGHRGSCICGDCLRAAYVLLVLRSAGQDAEGATCTLCLENRTERSWKHPENAGATACLRCVRQSAAVLQKDPDLGWKRPE